MHSRRLTLNPHSSCLRPVDSVEKRHRRGLSLSKRAFFRTHVSVSVGVLIYAFLEFQFKLVKNESRGAGCEPPARAPLRRKVGTPSWGERGDHTNIPPLDFVVFRICFSLLSNSSFRANGSRLS